MNRGAILIALAFLLGIGAVAVKRYAVDDAPQAPEPPPPPDDEYVDDARQDPANASAQQIAAQTLSWWRQATEALAGNEAAGDAAAAADAPPAEALTGPAPEPLRVPADTTVYGFFVTDTRTAQDAAAALPADPAEAGARLYGALAEPGRSLAFTLRFEAQDPGAGVNAVLAAAGFPDAVQHPAEGPRRIRPSGAKERLASLDEALAELGGYRGAARRAALWRIGVLDPGRVRAAGGASQPGVPLTPAQEALADQEGRGPEEQLIRTLRSALHQAAVEDRLLIAITVGR